MLVAVHFSLHSPDLAVLHTYYMVLPDTSSHNQQLPYGSPCFYTYTLIPQLPFPQPVLF